MTLLQLRDYIEDISLRHKDVKAFSYGSNFDIAVNKEDSYPQVFMELPLLIAYDLGDEYRDSVDFAINVLVSIGADNIESDFFAISLAKEIGDAIITYINENCDQFKIDEANSLSLREFSDDSVAGMRYDLTITLPRTCIEDWNDIFNLDE
jgi:hypothetical protein